MQGCKSIFILYVDPGFELILKRRIVAIMFKILTSEGFKMQDVDFKFRKFVFKGCKMKESRLIFLFK